jgi:hypothetical protein
MERERHVALLKRRAFLPLMVGTTVIVMVAVFLGTYGLGQWTASGAAIGAGIILMFCMYRMPFESLFWTKGVEGERKAAIFLEPLLRDGFVVLYNRMSPGTKGDIDSLVIGPTGIFPIETKNWSGKLEVRNDRLFVGDQERSWAIEQVYREALAVQVALGDELTARRVTVTPILCAIGGVAGGQNIAGGVHVTDGKHLAQLISARPVVFDDEAVERLARLADRRLRAPYEWEQTAP